MKIQTLSVVVPTRGCVNNCLCCVSKTHTNDYECRFDNKESDIYLMYRSDIKRRLDYAKLHKVDTIILTGTGEILQNRRFLQMFDEILKASEKHVSQSHQIPVSNAISECTNDSNYEAVGLLNMLNQLKKSQESIF